MRTGAGIFSAMFEAREREDLEQGLRIAVKRYYENYTDATQLDPEFIDALKVIARDAMIGHGDVEDIVEIVRSGEADVDSDLGRHVKTFPEDEV